jgi:hypothetical protein
VAGFGNSQDPDRLPVGAILVVPLQSAGRAKHCFVQPAEAEQQQKGADQELEAGLRNPG